MKWIRDSRVLDPAACVAQTLEQRARGLRLLTLEQQLGVDDRRTRVLAQLDRVLVFILDADRALHQVGSEATAAHEHALSA